MSRARACSRTRASSSSALFAASACWRALSTASAECQCLRRSISLSAGVARCLLRLDAGVHRCGEREHRDHAVIHSGIDPATAPFSSHLDQRKNTAQLSVTWSAWQRPLRMEGWTSAASAAARAKSSPSCRELGGELLKVLVWVQRGRVC